MGGLAQRLFAAAGDGNLAALQACLAAGASPQAVHPYGQGVTPLHLAAGSGHADCVAALLAAGARVGAATEDGGTALHEASRWGCPDCIATLLAAGARPSATDVRRQTPLHVAACNNHAAVLRLLLAAAPATALLRNESGRTPLQVGGGRRRVGSCGTLIRLP